MTKKVKFNGNLINFYDCSDCGMVLHNECGLRPNNKFCDKECEKYVEHNNLQKCNSYKNVKPND